MQTGPTLMTVEGCPLDRTDDLKDQRNAHSLCLLFYSPAMRDLWARPSLPISYLMPGREAAPTLVPGDLGVSLPSNKAVQIQALPFRHLGGR